MSPRRLITVVAWILWAIHLLANVESWLLWRRRTGRVKWLPD